MKYVLEILESKLKNKQDCLNDVDWASGGDPYHETVRSLYKEQCKQLKKAIKLINHAGRT